jgi:hypothetical protein
LSVGSTCVSFNAVEHSILSSNFKVYCPNGSENVAAEKLVHSTHFYTGKDISGAEGVFAAIAPNWMQISLTLPGGEEKSIVPYDGTGVSNYYAIYDQKDSPQPTGSAKNASMPVLNVPDFNNSLNNSNLPVEPIVVKDNISEKKETGIIPASSSDQQTVTNSDTSSVNEASSLVDDTNQSMLVNVNESMTDTLAVNGDTNISQTPGVGSNGMTPLSFSNGVEATQMVAKAWLSYDTEYFNRYGTQAPQLMTATLANVALRYEPQVKVTFSLTGINQLPPGVCTTTNSTQLMLDYRTYIINNILPSSSRDVASLFSGKTFQNGCLVKAFGSGTGAEKIDGAGFDGYGSSVSMQWSTSTQNAWALGFGIGLNLNGDSIFATGGGSPSWLYPTYSGQTTFSSTNANRIQAWSSEVLSATRLINTGVSSVDSHYLQASLFYETGGNVFTVGSTQTATYTLKNTGTSSITLQSVFMAARDAQATTGICQRWAL